MNPREDDVPKCLKAWTKLQTLVEHWGHKDAGRSIFVYLQMRTKLSVLDLMLTTHVRYPELQEISIANMKKWIREDTQEKNVVSCGVPLGLINLCGDAF